MANRKSCVVWDFAIDTERTEELNYLIENRGLKFFELDGTPFFSLKTIEGVKTYPAYGRICFHDIKRNEDGEIETLRYHIESCVYWEEKDGMESKLIQFLQKNYNFGVDADKSYRLKVNEEWHTYPEETQFKFYSIQYDEKGEVKSLRFHELVKGFKPYFPEDDVPEIGYMRKNYELTINPETPDKKYRIFIQGKVKEYPEGARILFWDYEYDEKGELINVKHRFQYLKWV